MPQQHSTPIDISSMPDLVQIVEEVAATKPPRELKRDNHIVAILTPTETNRKTSVQDALALAGAWKIFLQMIWKSSLIVSATQVSLRLLLLLTMHENLFPKSEESSLARREVREI